MRPDEHETRSRAYYDQIAPGYDAFLDIPRYREIRACFWQHVEQAVTASARILDFGAGSGLDAVHLAGLGHEVVAYDLSEGMVAVLRQRCAAQIAAGKVEPLAGALEEVREALRARAPFDAVVSNFAVFSSIPRLDPVFRLLGELVRPGGSLVVSIQNPWYPGDMRTKGFWRALLAAPVAGVIRYRSAELSHVYHYTPGQLRRAARPEFEPDTRPAPECGKTFFEPRSPFRVVRLRRA